MAAFFAGLNQFEKNLVIYGVGGYSITSILDGALGPKPHNHEAHHESHAAPAAAATPAAAPVAAAATPAVTEYKGKSDPMILFALQDIQSRLAVIEKALGQ